MALTEHTTPTTEPAGNMRYCEFRFTLDVVEGADDGEGFALEVDEQGEVLVTFDELVAGVDLS